MKFTIMSHEDRFITWILHLVPDLSGFFRNPPHTLVNKLFILFMQYSSVMKKSRKSVFSPAY